MLTTLIVILTLSVTGAALIYAARRVAAASPLDGEDFSFMVPLGAGALAIVAAMGTTGWELYDLARHLA